jgi:toxin CcdB
VSEEAMKQFDIADNPFPRSRDRQPFLLVLQSDLMARSLDTVVVAPLEPAAAGTFADRLNPHIDVEGQNYALIAQEIVTIRKSVLGSVRGSGASARDRIIAALDLLFTGF